jgi:hypothetical protein
MAKLNEKDSFLLVGYDPSLKEVAWASLSDVEIRTGNIHHSVSTMNGSCGSGVISQTNPPYLVGIHGFASGTSKTDRAPNGAYPTVISKN